MSRQRSDNREKAFRMWEKSGRSMALTEIAKRLGIQPSLVRKWKHLDAWEARPSKKRGGQPGNTNAVGNKGGAAPPGNKNAWKNGDYESLWLSEVAVEHRIKMMKVEKDPRKQLENEIMLLEFREMKMLRYINMIEEGWDGKFVEEKFIAADREFAGESLKFSSEGVPKFVPTFNMKMELDERKVKQLPKLERILAIENALSTVQGRKLRCIALLDQFDRNELTVEELKLKLQRMRLEVDKLKADAW